MKRYALITGTLAVLIVVLFVYRMLSLPAAEHIPPSTPHARDIIIHIPPRSWSFAPDHIEVGLGETFRVVLINDDDVEHGFALARYKVDVALKPHSTTTLPVLIAEKGGSFDFYCSLMCGQGVVTEGVHKGETRGHFDMHGTLVVSTTATSSAQ